MCVDLIFVIKRNLLLNLKYCTITKCYYLFNFTIFTDHEEALNLICMEY